jgi:O-antigen ligase
VQAYPLLGGGWGSNFYLVGNALVPLFKPNDIPFWHNDYLVVATQVGLPGLAVFLWIWVALAWITLRTYLQAPRGPLRTYLLVFLAAMAAMCTQALTDMFFWRNETGPLIWLIVGLICVTINLIRADREAEDGRRKTEILPPSDSHRPTAVRPGERPWP